MQQNGTSSWSKIAFLLGNRTDVQCRYRYKVISKNYLPKLDFPFIDLPALTQPINCEQTFPNPSIQTPIFQETGSTQILEDSESYQLKQSYFVPEQNQWSTSNINETYGQNEDEHFQSQIQNLESKILQQSEEIDYLKSQNIQLNKKSAIDNLNFKRFQKKNNDLKKHYNLILKNKSTEISNLKKNNR